MTTLIGTLIAAAVALVVGLRQSSVAQASGAADREIGKMRMAWLRDLRALLARYMAVLLDQTSEDYRKAQKFRADLRLMLNLPHDKLHQALWDCAEEVHREDDRTKRIALAERVTKAGRDVLKATWNDIKDEVHGRTEPSKTALTFSGLYIVAAVVLFLIGYVADAQNDYRCWALFALSVMLVYGVGWAVGKWR